MPAPVALHARSERAASSEVALVEAALLERRRARTALVSLFDAPDLAAPALSRFDAAEARLRRALAGGAFILRIRALV